MRALAATSVPVALMDSATPGLQVVWVNRAFAAVTGYDATTAAAGESRALARSRMTEQEAASFRAAVAAGRSMRHTLTLTRSDGSTFPSLVELSPVPAADGEIRYWVVMLQDLTEQLTQAAEAAALVEAERRERRHLGLIAQVSDLLMDVDDPHALGEIARLLCRTVVGWAAFYLNDNGLRHAEGITALRPVTGKGRRHGTAAHTEERTPVGDGFVPGGDAVQALLEGERDRPVEIDLEGAFQYGSASSWVARHAGRAPGVDGPPPSRRAVVYPVPGRRRVLGLLVVFPSDGGSIASLDSSTQTVLELTARRVGLVVDNARLYDREHRLAETLQRAMLPEQADVDGLDVWTYYAPNSENVQVGGDWYDVLQIAPDIVGVVIGDVVGHDVEAAAAMGQLRSVVRTYAFDVRTPAAVLERVDQIIGGMRIPRSAGLVLSTLTRTGAGWELEYSRAGHLPALLVRDGVATELSEAGGMLIGFGSGRRDTGRLALRPQDVLVYFTDGLIERRDRHLRDGMLALADVASRVTARDAAGIGEEVLSRLADHPEDDVAVVVVRVPDPAAGVETTNGPRRRRWSLPSEPASIGRARHAVLRTCEAWGLGNAANAELVVSELVANAVLHGYGHVSLQLDETGDGLRIEVEDANPAPPVTTDGHPGRVGGFGMQIVERLADWGWRPSPAGKVVWARVRPAPLPRSGRD
ncbi:ATP-binding SpoIIE family protein phosphatase [Cellulomonas alba]|nr:SpoIIE family protein phosphatase [Cellulomonas alba]